MITVRQALVGICASYRSRKAGLEPDLRRWEFFVQMLCSAYLSWRWLGSSARFEFWRPAYWVWLSQYSSLVELGSRASLAAAHSLPSPLSAEANSKTFVCLPFEMGSVPPSEPLPFRRYSIRGYRKSSKSGV